MPLKRAAWLAFIWHCAELAIVIALVIHQSAPVLVAVLLALSVVGWAWSCGHLPGRKA